MQVAYLEDVEFEFPIKPIGRSIDPLSIGITNASIRFNKSHKLIDGQIMLTIHEYMAYTDAVKSIMKSFGYYVNIEDLKCDLKCSAYGKHITYFKLNVLNPKNIKFMNKLVFTRIQISESTISVDTAVD